MAKKENVTEVTGGLTGTGGLLDGLNFGASRTVRDAEQQQEATPAVVQQDNSEQKTSAQRIPTINPYEGLVKKAPEKKSYRFGLLLKPSIGEKLEKATKEGKIRSRNDLINILLERHFALADAIENGELTTPEEVIDFMARQYFGE